MLGDINERTLENRINEEYECSFSEFRDKYSSGTKQKLVEKAIQMAMDGNTAMMIFVLKNLLNWQDKPITVEEAKAFVFAYETKTKRESSKAA